MLPLNLFKLKKKENDQNMKKTEKRDEKRNKNVKICYTLFDIAACNYDFN